MALVACVLLLAGCDDKSTGPLRVGLVVWPPFEMAYLARDLGFYDGADIKLIDYGSPAEFVFAYQSGSVDAVATVLDYALQIQHADPHQKIVLVIDHSVGGDAIVARPEIRDLADIRGRRIGYEASALGAYVLSRALEKAGLGRDDVIPVPIDVQDQEQAFRKGEVEAVVTYEPIVSILVGEGAHVVFDSSQIPEEIVDVLLVPDDVLERKRDQLQAFVDGWFKALAYFQAEPLQAAARVAEREGLTPEAYLQSFQKIKQVDRADNQRYLSGASGVLLDALRHHQRIMIRENFLPGNTDISSMLDASLVN